MKYPVLRDGKFTREQIDARARRVSKYWLWEAALPVEDQERAEKQRDFIINK